MSAHASYFPDQIANYFDRLGLPEETRKYNVSCLSPNDALEYLALLQKLQLAAIPFENISLHYSAHRSISIHPEEVFRKIISNGNGRGGYCMENNLLFGTLLYSLGFTMYSGGCRVQGSDSLGGWSHMVNFVTIGNIKYYVDVGFGADGPIIPMPLDRSGTVQKHIKPASARLEWKNIPGNRDPNQRLWVYEYRRDNDMEWEMKTIFTELEFLPRDYEVMNYFTSTNQRTFFTQMVVADKKILGEDGELIGKMSLAAASMKWLVNGKKTKELEFKSDAERLEALEKHFGMKLGQAEREGIAGLPSEIK
ncbi:NhoA Arylamine N-acetyltransferase [Pyrenophora tritici-repentis]|uniref:Arylamine N-acetyltransferase n=2 Tax=Pyrenophora tritici-repentis TaxID=45151 RepID=D8FSS6_9PLEO|nr:uncharacterized protein PTRG_02465 [Pyrenophora tritici-repentis Pt-1C-BFP]KAA8623492.1 Arylamine N-acetyltransferase 2 [Pyrenophora tritici-repentis]EDU44988.1 conserved hypothetical protein [Pyrenophora tritici-repentis Pt-1C-BFP]KAF7452497.1 Arylamine N-acetyltransferase 2 [Pyrenophora tritici-repentis]KAF7574368.1 NhoA, Arylamine N-acetyltransferase [Pyrenophora tritici-repentis]KAG9386834.1 Arylamine N-acetyltransferase 2 [Pyrenophora tritici-repentis]